MSKPINNKAPEQNEHDNYPTDLVISKFSMYGGVIGTTWLVIISLVIDQDFFLFTSGVLFPIYLIGFVIGIIPAAITGRVLVGMKKTITTKDDYFEVFLIGMGVTYALSFYMGIIALFLALVGGLSALTLSIQALPKVHHKTL